MAIGICAALSLLPEAVQAQGQAETEWPSVQVGGVDRCEAASGVALATYQFLSAQPRHSKFVLADICADIDAGWLVGPETFEGLTLVQSYGPTAAQYEVVSDGPTTLDRRGLTRSAVFTGLEDSNDGLPLDALAELSARVPGERATLMPGTDQWSMRGYLFGPPSEAPLPQGLWIASVHAGLASRLQGNEVVEASVSAFNMTFHLFDLTPDGFVWNRGLMGAEPVRLQLEFDATGGVSGGLAVDARNGRLEAARAPGEYDTATLEIGWLKGRVVAAETGPVIAAVGVGRSLFRDIPGNVNIEDGWVMITMAPVPPDMTADEIANLYGEAAR
ncbi:MAG: hypothetical protein AAFW64_04960 [Pseudomonadota bacterium]